MIEITEKAKCCGCSACKNACPKNCILMKPDMEGFLYPEIDKSNCIQCGMCEKVCPVLHVDKDEPIEQEAYLVQIKDEQIRRESTAGGAFTAIAGYILDQGGVVYGAAYDKRFQVEHRFSTTKSDLAKFRNSKYVQSNTKDTFQEVADLLKVGKLVCYSGTPCQIEGLKRFLRKDYSNLITVDVVCHAVPSPLIWNKYLEMQQAKLGTEISDIMFRDKHYGYKYSTMTFKGLDGKEVYAYGVETDPMLRAFFSDICDRPSCYSCVFKKRYRVSDFTLWDCYTVRDFDKSLDDDKGTTRVLIHSENGKQVFDNIKENLKYVRVQPDQLTAGVKEMFQSVSLNPKREQFFANANQLTGAELIETYFPETMKVRLERYARVFCYGTGIYSFIKRMYKMILIK